MDDSRKGLVPDDFIDDLVKTFQTMSQSKFNEPFSHYSKSTESSHFISTHIITKPSIKDILNFMEQKCQEYLTLGEWLVVSKKLDKKTFIAQNGSDPKFLIGLVIIFFQTTHLL